MLNVRIVCHLPATLINLHLLDYLNAFSWLLPLPLNTLLHRDADHNASGVYPECFMVYNCFQFHGFITNNKCRLLLRALSFTYCTSEVTLTLASSYRYRCLTGLKLT